jgi:uncharacterized membrane protein (DUF4010 family)
MEGLDLFLSLGIAVAAGLLIGLEREHSAPKDPARESFLGGSRTHPLLALVGAVSSLLTRQVGAAVLVVALVALVAFLLTSYVDDVRRGADRGITSEAAFLVSFLLGAVATSKGVLEPVSTRVFAIAGVAVVTTLLLSSKPALHPLARRVSPEDVTATLKFLIVTVVVLPLLPDRTMGPLEVLNPRKIGLTVVLIAAVSFAGYAAIRLLGPRRGIWITGLVGGVVSSTAVAISVSSRAREKPALAGRLALAVALASSIMFARMLVVVAAVNAGLVAALAVPLGAMLLVGLLGSFVLYRRSEATAERAGDVSFSNPFELSHALVFGLTFALVLLGSKAAATYLGTGGTYGAGLLAGAVDVDAVTLSMANLARREIPPPVAVTTVFLAAAANTVVKTAIATALGGWAYARRLAAVSGAAVVAGALALWLSPLG